MFPLAMTQARLVGHFFTQLLMSLSKSDGEGKTTLSKFIGKPYLELMNLSISELKAQELCFSFCTPSQNSLENHTWSL